MIFPKSAETKLLLTVERIDYSKAAAYADSPTYHRLEDYYKLLEGAYYVTRNGKIDKNFIDWRNWKVLFMEESRRGVLVSFTFDVCLLTHWKRTTMRRCFKERNITSAERYVARLKPGSTADMMRSIEDRLADYALSDDAGCGELLK